MFSFFSKINKSYLSLGTVLLLDSAKNYNQLGLEFDSYMSTSNSEFSWLSDNFSINGSGDTLHLFSYIWLTIVFFLLYLNIGIASLLFLLEAGLLSPIASMSVIQLLPLSSILFFLNAITMESVVGVIVVLTYSRDWAVRDFTKYQVLESNLFFYKNFSLIKNTTDSWSLFFFELMSFALCTTTTTFFRLLPTFKFFAILFSTFTLYNRETDRWVFVDMPTFINEFGYFGEVSSTYLFESFTHFYKKTENLSLFFMKSPITLKILEFTNKGSMANTKLFSELEFLETVVTLDLYRYFFNDFFYLEAAGKLIGEQRLSSYYRTRFTNNENPHNIVNNLQLLSGIYFDPTFLKKNNIFQNEYSKSFLTELVPGAAPLGKVGIYADVKNTDFRLIAENLNYEKQCALIINKERKNIKTSMGKFFNKNIFNFRLYDDILKNKKELRHHSLNQVINNLENSVYDEYYKYANFNVQKQYINRIIGLQKTPNLITDGVTTGYKGAVNFKDIFVGDAVNVKGSKLFYKLSSFSSVNTVSNKKNYKYFADGKVFFLKKLNSKFTTVGRLSAPKLKDYGLQYNFQKNNFFKNNIKKSRFLHPQPNNYFTGSTNHYTGKLNNYLSKIEISFLTAGGTLEWGSKNKHSIFSVKSKNLPWFDYSSNEELFIDKTAEILHNRDIYKNELYTIQQKPTIKNFVLKNFLDYTKENFSDSELLRRVRRSFRSKRKRKKGKKKFKKKNLVRGFNFEKSRSRFKSKIWKVRVNWSYSNNFEELYKYQNKTLVGFNLEKKAYLKRLGLGRASNPIRDFRQISKYGYSGFDNSIVSINSKQSEEFGLLYLPQQDGNVNYLQKTKVNHEKLTAGLHNKKLFSFKSVSDGENKKKFYNEINKQKPSNLSDHISGQSNFNTLKNYEKKLSNLQIKGLGAWNVENEDELDYSNSENSEFYNKLKLFWNNDTKSVLKNKKFSNFNNKKIVSDRFLKTFTKITNSRKVAITDLTNRDYKFNLKNKNTLKFLQNNSRMGILEKSFIKDNMLTTANTFNSLNKHSGKIVILEDSEAFDSNIRSFNRKPHTVYGLVWDEYLKHTYGFSMNFIDFNNKIKNTTSAENNLKTFDLWNKSFQTKLENAANISNKQTGLTLESNIANTMLTRMLAKSGFFKEIYNYDKLGLNVDNNYKKNIKFIKKLKLKNDIGTFSNKKKIKKYYKQQLLKDTINKASLTKQSIPYIKKFSETPTGFKYDTTEIGQKLPFFKKNIVFKNETIYSEFKTPKAKTWLSKKNETNTVLNRLVSSKKSKIQFTLDAPADFKKKRYQNSLLSLNGWHINDYFDLRKKNTIKITGLDKSPLSLKSYYLKDKHSHSQNRNSILSNTKRNLETIKPRKNKEFVRRLARLNKSSTNLFKKDRTKQFLNHNNFLKTNLSFELFEGGSLINNYNGLEKIDNAVFYNNVYNMKVQRNFDNFNIFEHRTTKQIRSFEDKKFFELKNIKKANYLNYNSIINEIGEKNDFWGTSSIIKNAKLDLNFLENTMNSKNYNNENFSENYKLSNTNPVDFLGFNEAYSRIGSTSNNINLFLDYELSDKNTHFLSEFYKTKSNLDSMSTIKNKKFSGLTNNITNFEYFSVKNNNNLGNKKIKIVKKITANYGYFFKKKVNCCVSTIMGGGKDLRCKTLINYRKLGILDQLFLNKSVSNRNIIKNKLKFLAIPLIILTILTFFYKKKKS